MRLDLLKRPFAAFLSLWILLVLVEPEALHSCPVHDATIGSHAGHGSHAMHHQHAPASSKSHHKAICSCSGDCSAPAAAALPANPPRVALASFRIVKRALIHVAPAPRAPAHPLLPFAIGPPSTIA